MKSQPCFEPPKQLEEAAEFAELRKRQAIARLAEKLGINGGDRFERAMRDLIDVDKSVLQEKGR
jgi:hypothetical protein